MRVSNYFITTQQDITSEAKIASHKFMLKSGMIKQSSAGIYNWLPLGLKVLQKIEEIVRKHMNAAGSVEILMPTLQSKDIWLESGRYDDYGKEMLRITDRHGRELIYGPTNEEMVTDIFRKSVQSYKQLPLNLYHIQWKFRDEIRPRFGVMRGREFLMKDAYSFDINFEDGLKSYHRMFVAYLKLFKDMGLNAIPMRAETGPIGGEHSFEFHVLADTGESGVFYDEKILELNERLDKVDYFGDLDPIIEEYTKYYAATEDVHDENDNRVKELGDKLLQKRGIEVGQVFLFGDKYSKPMSATVSSKDGGKVPVCMGSYGVGISRLVGAIIEVFHDDYGIKWPKAVAPFHVGIINIKISDSDCCEASESIYKALSNKGIEVLYDDRDERPGAKFSDMDLIGLPIHITVGPKGLKDGMVEVKNRQNGNREHVDLNNIADYIADMLANDII